MPYVLTRPVLWPVAGKLCVVQHLDVLLHDDIARLLRRGWVTFLPTFYACVGDFMRDDVSSALRLITPALTEPVTLAQAKAFLRIEHAADDAAITLAIHAARELAEQYLRLVLLPQTWEYRIANPCRLTVRLPIGPATRIDRFTLISELGASTALAISAYRLSLDGRSVLLNGALQVESVCIQFTAATYSTLAEIPAPIIQGMLHHISVMMEHRDGVVGLPMQSINSYAPFRTVSL